MTEEEYGARHRQPRPQERGRETREGTAAETRRAAREGEIHRRRTGETRRPPDRPQDRSSTRSRRPRTRKKPTPNCRRSSRTCKQEITALKKERPPLGKQLAELQEELKKRKEPPKLVESVIVRPGGVGSRDAHATSSSSNATPPASSCSVRGRRAEARLHGRHRHQRGLQQPSSTKVKTHPRLDGPLPHPQGRQRILPLGRRLRREPNTRSTPASCPMPNDGKIDLSLLQVISRGTQTQSDSDEGGVNWTP